MISKVVVGSKAANWHHPSLWPTPRDTDFIMTYDLFQRWVVDQGVSVMPLDKSHFAGVSKSGRPLDFEIAWPGSTAEELLHAADSPLASMDWLFTLKASHRFAKDSPHFEKTMRDYHMMKQMGCKIVDEEWLKRREAETYVKQRPRLNLGKKDFFVDSYKYDHDSIHVAVAHTKHRPAYELYKSDDAEVQCSKQKWDACSETVRLHGVLEETYVLALERSQIPFAGTVLPIDSFTRALEKVCTSITSGWFRAFAYDNYYRLLEMYDAGYVAKFRRGLADGIVKEATT